LKLHVSLNSQSVFKVQTLEIVSVNCSHVLFFLLSTNGDLMMEGLVWLCMVWFRSIWFGMVGFDASLCCLALCNKLYAISLKATFSTGSVSYLFYLHCNCSVVVTGLCRGPSDGERLVVALCAEAWVRVTDHF
jgi:hypothetical protein